MSSLHVKWLGRNITYEAGMAAMQEAIASLIADPSRGQNTLFLLEHENVVTGTTQGGDTYLKTNRAALAADGIHWAHAARGGDVTFHGRGQLVGYPVVRLPFLADPPAGRVDILKYLRTLKNSLMQTCQGLGLLGVHTQKDRTGIWITEKESTQTSDVLLQQQSAKMIAIGIGVKRGITRHGFAFNLHTNLEHFTKHIVPCGLENRAVTSLERVLARQKQVKMPPLPDLCQAIASNLAMGLRLKPPSKADFERIPASLALES